MTAMAEPTFLVDINVGDLTKWLRAMGYDAVCLPHASDAELIGRALADGRVFTGRQAVANGLIDAIGSESAARDWLASQRDVPRSLPVFDMSVDHDKRDWLASARDFTQKMMLPERLTLDGLISLWHPGGW